MIGLLIMGAMMIAYFFVVTIAMFFALTMATVLQSAPGWMQIGAAIIFVMTLAAAPVGVALLTARPRPARRPRVPAPSA